MKKISGGPGRLLIVVLLLLAILVTGLIYRFWRKRVQPPAQQPIVNVLAPARPAGPTGPASKESEKSVGYIDVVRAAYPAFPATQPLGFPLDLSQAAHLVLHDPIYLGGIPRIEMWITRADAAPTIQVLKDAIDPKKDADVHVLRERVVFVHWMPAGDGPWRPYLVCRKNDGGYQVISAAHGQRPLPVDRGFHWEHAFSWNEKVVVPAARGVSIFAFAPDVTESYHELAKTSGQSPAGGYAEPRVMQDGEALLCWIPWEDRRAGGRGASRYVQTMENGSAAFPSNGKWTDLTPDEGWPEKILHMVPMRDGPVLLMTVDEQAAVHVGFKSLEHAPVKEQVIEALVEQLSDSDQKVRKKAYDELSQYGAGIWPILEKLMDDQGAEAQARMRQLLKQKVTPTLNGMVLLGSKSLKLAARLSDGGTVFFADAGVSFPDPEHPDAEPDYRVPAWISIRPGQPIGLLSPVLTGDLIDGKSRLDVVGGDWIVTGDVRGARRFVYNGFVSLLRKKEQGFEDFIGVDRRGRWLFREFPAAGPATAPATADSRDTLVIDPTLPDPAPRLPVWVYQSTGVVGWNKAGWAVARTKTEDYALDEHGWHQLEPNEPVFTKPQDAPPPVEPSAAGPGTPATTIPSPPPSTAPAATQQSESPILTDREGNRYFGGLTELRVVSRAGFATTWPLPALATGQGLVSLVRAGDSRLFLFNRPGRVLRIKRVSGGAEPFVLEKVFTHRIPTIEHPTRIWVDPAGRIIMAAENQLTILFPSGYIPPAIVDLMRPEAIDDSDEE